MSGDTAYLNLVSDVLMDGNYKPNRTGVDTISAFSQHYEIDLQQGFPLLTTKKMDGFRWDSMLHELVWYLSGQHHVRDLREKTGIWDEWSDDDGLLDTAYGRFWRRYPVPDEGLEGESWPDEMHRWMNGEGTFDQLQYALDQLNENPRSRRIVINAWHPANAAVSTLPPCHYTFVFNVQGDRLNVHLTQRSGDIALGVPFNIASYALLAKIVATRTGFEVGTFAHSIVDAHVYCGQGERGQWYEEHLPAVQDKLESVRGSEELADVSGWLASRAPGENEDQMDHVPGLIRQLARTPFAPPSIEVADKPLDEIEYGDFELREYESHDGLSFGVAE